MNAPVRLGPNPETLRISDLQFIGHLRRASRKQLYDMRKVFKSLGGPDWKRAAVEARLAKLGGYAKPWCFDWLTREEWWRSP